MAEFDHFSAKIQWQAHFQTLPPRTDDPALRVRKECIAQPPDLPLESPIPNYLTTCKNNLTEFFTSYNPVINNHNRKPLLSLPYTNEEINTTLTKLRNNKNIVIKVADKSSAIVILDTDDYHQHALSHLRDIHTYKELDTLPNHNAPWDRLIRILTVSCKLYKHNQHGRKTDLARKLLEFAPTTRTDPPLTRPARFYVVMKMHKNPIASRPIASSINTITHNVSKYLDNLLQPIMKKMKTYTKSSTQVVNTLKDHKLPRDCVLMCLDVEALYPNIPIKEGVAAIHTYLNHKGMPLMEADFVCALMNWVLSNNYIEYGDLLFLQIKGTAMGTPFAVVFANLFLAHLEEHIVLTQLTDYQKPILSFRFIDDIFSIFRSQNYAQMYRDKLNEVYPTINTTGTISDTSGIFLDIEIFKGPNFNQTQTLDTKLYQKSTNKYLYLSPATYHPKHVLTGFITSEIKRYRILCSQNTDFTTAKNNFHQRLIQRYYPTKFLEPLFTKHYERTELLTQQEEEAPQTRPTFSTTLGPDIEQIPLSRLLDPTTTLTNHPELTSIFKDQPPLMAKTHPHNLGQQIIRARIKFSPKPEKPLQNNDTPNSELTFPNWPEHPVYNKPKTPRNPQQNNPTEQSQNQQH